MAIGPATDVGAAITGRSMAAQLLEESVDVAATPQQVWSVISDLKRMGEWSPQCVKMIVRGGVVQRGTRTININRRGPLVWPTTAKVVRFEPNHEIGFRINENRSVWSYAITPKDDGGVRLTERREVTGPIPKVPAVLVEKFFGGTSNFETELQAGMRDTLGKVKRAAESSKS